MSKALRCERCNGIIQRVLNVDDSQGDNALHVTLSGGYSQFIDNELENQPEPYTQIMLCHKCGHDFMTNFMDVPAEKYSNWHPSTGDRYCEGWTIDE